MNQRGFVASALLYGMLVLFLTIMLSILYVFGNNKLSMDKMKEGAISDVTGVSTWSKFAISNEIKASSIKVKILEIEGSEGLNYEFSLDGENFINNGTNNEYLFENLEPDKDYVIYVRVTTPSGEVKTQTFKLKTAKLTSPTFSEVESGNKVIVNIEYPKGCGTEYVCKYRKNSEQEQIVTTTSTSVEFSETGKITATVSDQVNETKEEYNVEVFKLSLSGSSTTNSATITATPSAGSEVVKYEFAENTEEYTDNRTDNVYTFSGLKQDTEYTFNVRAITKTGKIRTEKITTKTSKLGLPSYSQKETDDGKSVTITYPKGCGDTLTCTYQKNDGEEQRVTTDNAVLEFTETGTLTATVTDGTNVERNSYNVEILKLELILNKTTNSIGVTATPSEGSEVIKYEFSQDDSNYINNEANNEYIFTGLTHNTEYTLYVRATTTTGITKKVKATATTDKIEVPTFAETSEGDDIVVVINYLEGCGDTLTCTYQIDDNEAQDVDTEIENVMMEATGTLTATITDGINTISDSKIIEVFKLDSSIVSTTNSITLTAIPSEGSEVEKYEFSEDGENYVDNGTNNVYVYTGLKPKREYKYYVRATTVTGITKVKEVVAYTNTFQKPTFTEEQTDLGKNVTMTFPEECKNEYRCYYQKNDGEQILVTETEVTEEFTETGIILVTMTDAESIDTITDDNVTETLTYNVEILKLNLTSSSTINSITLTAIPSEGSEVTKYEFSVDNNTWIDNGTNNVYQFQNLTHNTEYTLYVRATTAKDTIATTSISVTTAAIAVPTYSEVASTYGKKITVSFPSGCTDYTCQYSINGQSWVTITDAYTQEFSEPGTIIGRVIEKANTNNIASASTYTFKMPSVVYRNDGAMATTGEALGSWVERTTTASSLGQNYYLKHVINPDTNLITASYVCIVTNKELCFQGGNSGYYTANKNLLKGQESWFTSAGYLCGGYDSPSGGYSSDYSCAKENGLVDVRGDGSVNVSMNSKTCMVNADGTSYCS